MTTLRDGFADAGAAHRAPGRVERVRVFDVPVTTVETVCARGGVAYLTRDLTETPSLLRAD